MGRPSAVSTIAVKVGRADDAHFTLTPGAGKRIGVIDLSDEVRLGLFSLQAGICKEE